MVTIKIKLILIFKRENLIMFRRPDYNTKQEELQKSKFLKIIHLKWNIKVQNNNYLDPESQQKQKEDIEEKNLNLVDIALYNLEELDVSFSS